VSELEKDIARSAAALLASLSDEQRAVVAGSLDDPDLREWTYLPGDRPGLSFEHLTPEQRRCAEDLVVASHGELGADLALGVVATERIRRQLATGKDDVGGDRYWLRVWGDPDGDRPWGWRVNGHHLGVHVVVVGGAVTITPHFIGAEPARVPSGPAEGKRLMGPEEDLARELLAALDADQRAVAVVADVAPHDILTRFDPVADPDRLPAGLARDDMTGDQRAALDTLVLRYLDRAPRAYARACLDELQSPGAGRIGFAWAGPVDHYDGHYYCVRTPTFLIEYDNTQDDANHAHSVWRHLRHDFGHDPLQQHYAAQHRPSG
jgi:hypothetical protein